MRPREAENQSPLNQYHKSKIMQHRAEMLCHQVVELYPRAELYPSDLVCFNLKREKL